MRGAGPRMLPVPRVHPGAARPAPPAPAEGDATRLCARSPRAAPRPGDGAPPRAAAAPLPARPRRPPPGPAGPRGRRPGRQPARPAHGEGRGFSGGGASGRGAGGVGGARGLAPPRLSLARPPPSPCSCPRASPAASAPTTCPTSAGTPCRSVRGRGVGPGAGPRAGAGQPTARCRPQALASSVTGALATQAVLRGVGVGDRDASVAAATTTWILKGQRLPTAPCSFGPSSPTLLVSVS